MSEEIQTPAPLADTLRLHPTLSRYKLVEAVLRQLELDHRIDIFGDRPLRMTTNHLALTIGRALNDVCLTTRLPIPATAAAIATGTTVGRQPPPPDLTVCAAAVLDFGWGHHAVSGTTALLAMDDMSRIYRDQMQTRVLKMLRRWESFGWIADSTDQRVSGVGTI